MSISPLYKGDTPVIHGTFEDDDGAIVDLTGLDASTFVMHLIDQAGNHKVGTGAWTVLDAAAGTADYQMTSADTSTADVWQLYPVLPFSTRSGHFDPQNIVIENLP